MTQLRSDGDVVTLDQSAISAQAEFTVCCVDPQGSVINGVSWTFCTSKNDYYVWYNITDAEAGVSDPALHPAVGIPVSLASANAEDGGSVMEATLLQINKLSEVTASVTGSSLTITEVEFGSVDPAAADGALFVTGGSVAGSVQVTVVTKFLDTMANGSLVNIIAENTSTYDISSSNAAFLAVVAINPHFNPYASVFLDFNLGASTDNVEKTDNRPLLGVS